MKGMWRTIGWLCAAIILGSAQAEAFIITGSIFRLSSGTTVDYIFFTVNSRGTVVIDTRSWERDSEDRFNSNGITNEFVDVNGDGEISFFNTALYLFLNDGVLDASKLVASNDNSSRTYGDGSISRNDAYLKLTLDPGSYVLAIGAATFTLDEAISGFNSGTFYPVGENFRRIDHGDYQITISGDVSGGASVVPEPVSAALLGAGLLVSVLRLRRGTRCA